MKKEVFIAIIIGFVIGLMITYGIYTAQRSLNKASLNVDSENNTAATPSVTPTSIQNLTITSPENGQVYDQNSVKVIGSTAPNGLVAIIGAKDYTTAAADDQGNFSGEVTLVEGANQLTVKTYDNSGIENQENLTVIYIPVTSPKEASASPTPKKAAL